MTVFFITTRSPLPVRKGDQVVLRQRRKNVESFSGEISGCENSVVIRLALPWQKDTFQAEDYIVIRRSWIGFFMTLFKCVAFGKAFQTEIYCGSKYSRFLRTNVTPKDIVHTMLSRTCSPLLGLNNREFCWLFEEVDVLSDNFRQKARSTSNWFARRLFFREATLLLDFEKKALEMSDCHVLVAHRDARANEKKRPSAKSAWIIENSVNIPSISSGDINYLKMCFFGNLNYWPNQEAVLFLCRSKVIESFLCSKGLVIDVVGRDSRFIKNVVSGARHLRYVGEVEDMNDCLQGYSVAIFPMLSGTGIQNKVLEAMSLALLTLATPNAVGSISVNDREHFLQFHDEQQLVSDIQKIIDDMSLISTIGSKARKRMFEKYSFQRQTETVWKAYSTMTEGL